MSDLNKLERVLEKIKNHECDDHELERVAEADWIWESCNNCPYVWPIDKDPDESEYENTQTIDEQYNN